MGKFNFSRPGRKKPSVPRLAVTEPSMSKAHKVLGSTPLSIDSPAGLDDTPSPTISVGDRVRIAASERQWGHEPDSSPSSLRFNAMGDGMGYGAMESPSSPTMKPWTPTPATTKGLPSKAHRILDTDNTLDSITNMKKKPSKLDFSNIVGSRLSRKESPAYLDPSGALHPGRAAKSPSILSPFSSASGRQGDMRKMLKRRTKESLRSFFPDSSSPVAGQSPQREGHSDNGLSTLYDHYEQMTFRQVTKQYFKSEDSPDNPQVLVDSQDEIEWRAAEADHDLDWVHKTLASAPPTAGMHSSSPGARSISSRYTRTSKASKHTDRSLQETDFQEKSVLMLSSDSEGEEVELATSIRSRPPVPARGSSDLDRSLAPHEKRQSKTSVTRRSPDRRSSRQSSKRASFAAANTYITIPSVENNRSGPVRSRSKSPRGESTRAPSRGSLNSNNSTGSGLTCQIGYGIQETQAFTVLPARRPSLTGLEQETTPLQASGNRRRTVQCRSPNQLTPPMSPSSMNSYLGSARSSMDGSGGQNRIMALTRQEEMLISAIRKKNQDMRDNARLESNRPSLFESREARGSNASQATMTEASIFDFDFPVPPNFDKKKQQQQSEATMIAKRNSSTTKKEAYSPSDDDSYLASSLRPSDAVSQKVFLENASQGSQESAEHQDALVYVDDEGRPISDEDDGSGLDESIGIATDFLLPVSWHHSEDGHTTEGKGNIPIKARPQSERLCVSPAPGGLATVSEDKVDDVEDMPRPDSPIAPDSFPPVPHRRTTISNMARLSAVGCARRDTEPGWWGDDD